MEHANDNQRPNYKRKPLKASRLPKPEPRPIYAWEIDSRLSPENEGDWTIVGFG